jgi:hypothetical protein
MLNEFIEKVIVHEGEGRGNDRMGANLSQKHK